MECSSDVAYCVDVLLSGFECTSFSVSTHWSPGIEMHRSCRVCGDWQSVETGSVWGLQQQKARWGKLHSVLIIVADATRESEQMIKTVSQCQYAVSQAPVE